MNEEHEQEIFPYLVYKVQCSGMEKSSTTLKLP